MGEERPSYEESSEQLRQEQRRNEALRAEIARLQARLDRYSPGSVTRR